MHRAPRLTLPLLSVLFLLITYAPPAAALPLRGDDTPGAAEPVAVSEFAAPSLLSPSEGLVTTGATHPPLGVPELRWTTVPGAKSYRIQFSQDIGFATKLEVTTGNTSYTPMDIRSLPDGIWYWRVRVDSPSPPSGYSGTRSFQKQWAGSSSQPTLVSPSDGADLEFFDAAAFTWQPVVGAASYRWQVAASADGFSTPLQDKPTLAASYQPTAKLANGTYYWRIVPLDPSNRAGMPSEVRQFTVTYGQTPAQLEPVDNAEPTFTPTFRWTAVRGAQYYRLEYSTDPYLNTAVTAIDTRNTTYTPTDDLPNDVNLYWRVRAQSGSSLGPWSDIRTFIKRWYIQPQLLTPTNNYGSVRDPFFSWTPVPGASYYRFEISCENSFPPPTCGWIETTANTTYALQPSGSKWLSVGEWWYWRVTPYDNKGNAGKPSGVYSFRYGPFEDVPQSIYPLYHYTPDPLLQPQEDRTVALPVFMWHRWPTDAGEPAAFRVQVSTDSLFESIVWTADTQNYHAAPTVANPFVPTAGVDYYWQVVALDGLGSPGSQKWKARFDTARQLTQTTGTAPALLRPVVGSEWVETVPLLEWWPLQGADSYDVQISADPTFSGKSPIISAAVPFPAYAHPSRLVYDGDPSVPLPYGTYYWRVRGRSGGSPGAWSDPWRFEVAAQSRLPGDESARKLIASDPLSTDMSDANYDLSALHVTQDDDNWNFGFPVAGATDNMRYGLYLDLDGVDGSGAPYDPRGYNIATIPAHQPEYAIYIWQNSGSFDASWVYIYRWDAAADDWATPQTLADVLGVLSYAAGHLEIQVPNTAVGMEDRTNSAAVSLFSIFESGGHAQDTVPSDPAVTFASPDGGTQPTVLSRFARVSERLTLVTPPNNTSGDPTTFSSVPPFFWHLPTSDVFLNLWHGFDFQVALDPIFTTPMWDYRLRSSPVAIAPPSYTPERDFNGDNTYYWRVRPLYTYDASKKGAWSQPGRFERQGFMPQNLRTSVSFATPTFSWDMTEGAAYYELQVDDDPKFGGLDISVKTARSTYTPRSTLRNGTYYWRVRVYRFESGKVINDWTPAQVFTLSLPLPSGLRHEPAGVASRAPTLCWDPLIVSADSVPVLAAWKYRVQVSQSPNFATIYDNVDTEQACWTPTKGYHDGTYYWRVALIDGDGRLGDFSSAAQFTKQYPITTLISPTNGSLVSETPTFTWTPVHGAAEYRLEVSLYPTFAPLYDSANTDNTTCTPTKRYESDKTYYWRVRMKDVDGREGIFTDATVLLNQFPIKLYVPVVVR